MQDLDIKQPLRLEKKMELVLVTDTFQMSGMYRPRTVTAILAVLPEKAKAAILKENPYFFKSALLQNPMLIRGTMIEGDRPDYNIEMLAHVLGAKRLKKEDI